jgi:hypothetical protein
VTMGLPWQRMPLCYRRRRAWTSRCSDMATWSTRLAPAPATPAGRPAHGLASACGTGRRSETHSRRAYVVAGSGPSARDRFTSLDQAGHKTGRRRA